MDSPDEPTETEDAEKPIAASDDHGSPTGDPTDDLADNPAADPADDDGWVEA